ncbi:MAG: glycine dehydrogenase (aminomethyl-transferring) [Candidatus Omnitrophica bacterium CG1_02_44_16]|nr:MAG: glycine dehydrogenase (aminomethyl-transferring) [Candidatus Omnitrophica bacterium CG1_02_44_16]PIY82635.1 MAG: glycine dehydrogenase (aminomethyl-transferring) [Candidatus Omnitrophica bacterium CG_4_10_14_0_8_um_filter_44_12]PIZ84011.1 MAG: glycine dehydrogenase (aminomethyl-transferring) [Candidatus Omnitrophica bacterium CG_4_10_14_0_2_um_filter_44_9]
MELIFKKSSPGRRCTMFSKSDVPEANSIPLKYLRNTKAQLPELSELDVVRHFTNLSKMNFSVDTNFYPLGSCTMKYNPKFTEDIAKLEGFTSLHPLLPQLRLGGLLTQGALEVLYCMEELLCEITGMNNFTLQPAAGAHGELTGVMLIAAYHRSRNDKRKYVLVPDSAHGTNPASAAIVGYEIINIPSNKDGLMDIEHLKEKLTEDVAAIMMTCPNTLGLFESEIDKIAKLAHQKGALMYYDGANLNAILGKCRPGDLGFDVIHLNLHKTFSTPHGGGGPGAGPVGVKKELSEFLPISRVVKRDDGTFYLDYKRPNTIGCIAPFYGNFLVILKAYAYILLLGKEGLIKTSEHAVLNANYMLAKLNKYFTSPHPKRCMHECVLSGVHALDIAKFLIDRGIHPPTIYFPLIVKEALMIEPTETESKETMDHFIECMIEAARLLKEDPDALKKAPKTTPVGRLDETKAARDMNCALL